MRTALAVFAVALILVFALGAVLYTLAGDLVGAGFFLVLTLASAVLFWIAADHVEEI